MPISQGIGKLASDMTIFVRSIICFLAEYSMIYVIPVVEERPDVQRVTFKYWEYWGHLVDTCSLQAIQRLTPREHYDRAFRLKRASQASVLHKPLPKEQWLAPEEVCPSASPFGNYI